ncbi:MAG TPA: hypothetical protein VK997_06175, partial [Deferrisomatales bacterium]|nr:hypothetical protein [Deferrisomatales bacterium]
MNRLKTTALLTLLTLLLVTMGNAIGGTGGMVAALLLAAAMNFGTYWYSDKLVLRMYRAREVSDGEHPEFHDMVRGLAQRAGLPMPRVYIIPSESPNAFA